MCIPCLEAAIFDLLLPVWSYNIPVDHVTYYSRPNTVGHVLQTLVVVGQTMFDTGMTSRKLTY